MKTFLSIGSGPGIGAATAERFAREGYRVVLAARNTERLNQIAHLFNNKGYTTSVAYVDVANLQSIAQLVADTESRFGPIDTLHYNAAVMHDTSIDSIDEAGFQYDLSVNIGGAYASIRAVLPMMGL